MFHQVAYSTNYDFHRVENNRNFSFPSHVHSCYEVLFVTSGEMEVVVGDQKKLMKANEGVIIFPHQAHSLKTPKGSASTHTLCIFSQSLVRHFNKAHQKEIPAHSFYNIDPSHIPLLKSLEFETNINTIKGVLYLICGHFEKQTQFVPCNTMNASSETLISQIFAFIEENAHQDCSLTKLAETMPYSYVHLSRFFKQVCGITFVEYVNHYRVSEACYMLKNTDKSVTNIGLECGYTSVRSFNRNFKEVTGMTPREYQKQSDNP